MTPAALRKAEAAYRAASERAEQLRLARNEAMRRAVADGMRKADVARELGLGRSRVGQILSPKD